MLIYKICFSFSLTVSHALFLSLQNVPPAILLRFLREHRSEWADTNIDAYSAAVIKAGPCSLPGARAGGGFGSQVILPLANTIEHEEVSIYHLLLSKKSNTTFFPACKLTFLWFSPIQFMEVIKLENMGYYRDDMTIPGDIFLLQVSNVLQYLSFQHISSQVFGLDTMLKKKNCPTIAIKRKHFCSKSLIFSSSFPH